MGLYLVVIADVIRSRGSKEAASIDERLRIVNGEAKDGLLVPFRCLRGDEIEAVLDTGGSFIKTVRTLKHRLRPLKIRIGLGFGTLDVQGALPEDPFALNGEAFFAAREALDSIKQMRGDQETILLRSPYFRDSHADDETWDIVLRMYGSITSRWNAAQWDAVMEYDRQGLMTGAADRLDKLYQSVQRSLDRARWDVVRDCEAWMEKHITELADASANGANEY